MLPDRQSVVGGERSRCVDWLAGVSRAHRARGRICASTLVSCLILANVLAQICGPRHGASDSSRPPCPPLSKGWLGRSSSGRLDVSSGLYRSSYSLGAIRWIVRCAVYATYIRNGLVHLYTADGPGWPIPADQIAPRTFSPMCRCSLGYFSAGIASGDRYFK